jgi:N utilization substance protein B
MGKRRKAREIVLQALYESEFSDTEPRDILDQQIQRRAPTGEVVAHAEALFFKTIERLDELDRIIAGALENWDMTRVALIDKNILRFALAEILYFDSVPSKVIVNEAIEVAHRFSSEDAGRFINGVLDRFIREYRKDVV